MRFGYRLGGAMQQAGGPFTHDLAGRGEAEEPTSLSVQNEGALIRIFDFAFELLFCPNAFKF
jgi:hypothetical protein